MNNVGFSHGKVDMTVIEEVEETLGIKFPESYKILLSENDYLDPVKNCFTYTEPSGDINENSFIYAGYNDEIYGDKVKYLNQDYKDYYKQIVRFGCTGNGDDVGFDYRSNKVEPAVVLILHDWFYDQDEENEKEWLVTLAKNFDEFVCNLYEPIIWLKNELRIACIMLILDKL